MDVWAKHTCHWTLQSVFVIHAGQDWAECISINGLEQRQVILKQKTKCVISQKTVSIPLSLRAEQGAYGHLFLINNKMAHLFLLINPNPSSWGATCLLHLRKAASHFHGAKNTLQVSTLHTEWQLPFVMHQRGSTPGGLAAQRLGNNPASVKVWANRAENFSVSTKNYRAGESKVKPANQWLTNRYFFRPQL